MSVIKQFIIQISLANILKLFLILRKLSALYSYKGYSYRKKACIRPIEYYRIEYIWRVRFLIYSRHIKLAEPIFAQPAVQFTRYSFSRFGYLSNKEIEPDEQSLYNDPIRQMCKQSSAIYHIAILLRKIISCKLRRQRSIRRPMQLGVVVLLNGAFVFGVLNNFLLWIMNIACLRCMS